jgi:hypothetical protein
VNRRRQGKGCKYVYDILNDCEVFVVEVEMKFFCGSVLHRGYFFECGGRRVR